MYCTHRPGQSIAGQRPPFQVCRLGAIVRDLMLVREGSEGFRVKVSSFAKKLRPTRG